MRQCYNNNNNNLSIHLSIVGSASTVTAVAAPGTMIVESMVHNIVCEITEECHPATYVLLGGQRWISRSIDRKARHWAIVYSDNGMDWKRNEVEDLISRDYY